MPRGDRTGPQGEGPMTGRQMGYCAGFDGPGYSGSTARRMGGGFRGRGGGWGFRRKWQNANEGSISENSTHSLEMQSLKSELAELKNSMKKIMEKLNLAHSE